MAWALTERKRIKDSGVNTRAPLLAPVAGTCGCPARGGDPNLHGSQCSCVDFICLGGRNAKKTHKHCISNSSQ